MKKIFYNTLGVVSSSLGVLGAFLPLLPSTCFVLLATWAFAKSSPRYHAWLLYKSPFAQSIQAWQQHQVIPNRIKWVATVSIFASYSVSALLVNNRYIIIGLGIGMLILTAYLFSKPSQIPSKHQTTYSQTPELHQPVI